jgi:hypothetical protein
LNRERDSKKGGIIMKKMAVLLGSILMAAAFPLSSMAADVNVNVQVGQPEPAPAPVEVTAEAPPPLEVQNPEMVVVPSGNSYVYMVPNVYGVYFHNGFWFRHYNGIWFRSAVYNSGWVAVRPAIVPGVVIGVYPEYAMYLPAGYFRIGWGDFHSHWRGWGYNHWHRNGWFQHEMRARAERHRHIERQRSSWARGEGHRPAGYNHKGVHKAGPSGIHKTGPAGTHKVGPAGTHKVGPAGTHKVGPAGTHKVGPAGTHKVGPAGTNKGTAHGNIKG